MNLSRHFKTLMASAVSFSLAATPMLGVGVAHAQNAPAAEAPGDAGWQKEFEVWRSASKAGKAADYEMYLKSYPTGKFASVAKKRIDELSGAKPADTAKIDAQKTADVAQADTAAVRSTDVAADDAEKKRDLELWRQVSKTGTQADYEKYLKAFPKGKFAKVAKTRIETMVAKAGEPVVDEQNQAQADDQQNQAEDSAQVTEQPATDDQADQTSVQADNVGQNDQTKVQSSDWEQEYALWKAASDGNNIGEYEAYLSTYPKGKFAAIAQARIVQLAAAEQPVANVDEGDTAQSEDKNKVDQTVKNTQADDQQQVDQAQNQDPNQADQGHMNQQPDDQQMANNQQDDQSEQDKMGQNTQDQNIQYSEGTPETEDQFLNREGRHEIQGRLTSLGYDTNGSDGAFGQNSRTAISNWQQDNGAPATGYLSGDQIAQIRKLSQVSYAEWLNSQPVVVEQKVVRPRREKVVVIEERTNPGLDAAIAVGVLGAVIGAQKFGKHNKFGKMRPGKVKVIGKFKMGKMNKFNFGGCKKKRRC
ncbi:MAG: hypothetical protein JWM58_3183 [Rhizobium sp.]|nr:hypothetical protein [Rhizobium sp.]